MTRLLLIGASGYIGGQVLVGLVSQCPDVAVSAIVRNAKKADVIRRAFSTVRVVQADLDDIGILEEEASQASIVLHLASSSHITSVKAIHEGLKRKQNGEPVYWIQISGARLLAAKELSSPDFVPGSPSSQIFDDVTGLQEIRVMIREHPSRIVDNYLLDVAADNSHIKTALVIPPMIFGEGQGPVNKRSCQIPELCRLSLSKGRGVMVGQGLNRWGNIHVGDVSALLVALVKRAANSSEDDMLWGENGIFLAGVGETTFHEIASRVTAEARKLGYLKDEQYEHLDKEAADKLLPLGSALFGTNARGNARRAREFLHWQPSQIPLEEDIARSMRQEADSLAGVVSGEA